MGFRLQESNVREGLRNDSPTVLKFGLTYQIFFSLSAHKHQTCAHRKQSNSMAMIPTTHIFVFYTSAYSLWHPQHRCQNVCKSRHQTGHVEKQISTVA